MKNIFKIFLCFFVLSLSFTLISCGKNKEDDNKKTEVEESGDHEHDFSKWVTTKEPTCTKDGQKVRECDCGEKEINSCNRT